MSSCWAGYCRAYCEASVLKSQTQYQMLGLFSSLILSSVLRFQKQRRKLLL